jgi:hypothetical protein
MTSTHYSNLQARDGNGAVPRITGHFIGLDLGQARDHTAIAVLERTEISLGQSPVTFERIIQTRYSFRHLERLPLGMDYPSMVEHVRTLVQRPELAQSQTTLVVDATGVGRPVVDLLRRASLPCRVVPVTITGGDKETCESIMWHVPKRDLIAGLMVLFQRGEVAICGHLPESETLAAELAGMRIKVSLSGHDTYGTWREGEHDDLVLAAALACWRGARAKHNLMGAGRLL